MIVSRVAVVVVVRMVVVAVVVVVRMVVVERVVVVQMVVVVVVVVVRVLADQPGVVGEVAVVVCFVSGDVLPQACPLFLFLLATVFAFVAAPYCLVVLA